MNRSRTLDQIQSGKTWDLLVVGGGATGLGVAVDAAARGYQVLLLEQSDFCKATSSRSTKLIHGGVRYLEQGEISLVRSALRERGRLLANAPHLVRPLGFVLPVYTRWQAAYYLTGLKFYNWLAGRRSLGRCGWLPASEVRARIPGLKSAGLRGGVLYFDAQFDDARLGISLALTATDLGASLANYVRVQSLLSSAGRLTGARVEDLESGAELNIDARVVINATGVFSDRFRRLDAAGAEPLLRPSRGIHLVLNRKIMPGQDALIVPRTEDGRVLFAIPYHDYVLVGTTDTPVHEVSLEPRPLASEIEYLMRHLAQYFQPQPTAADVQSVFAGLRPLVGGKDAGVTAALSRDHCLLVSPTGLVTITGGKWTTYRQMAQDTVDRAATVAQLPAHPCRTRSLRLHGWTEKAAAGCLQVYGEDATKLRQLTSQNPEWSRVLHPRLTYQEVQVIWAVRHEMARKVEDVLARRTQALFLDAEAAIESAGKVATLMGRELGWSDERRRAEQEEFVGLAQSYLPAFNPPVHGRL